jgi:hypothetical protein
MSARTTLGERSDDLPSKAFTNDDKFVLLLDVIKCKPETFCDSAQLRSAEYLGEPIAWSIPNTDSTDLAFLLQIKDPLAWKFGFAVRGG